MKFLVALEILVLAAVANGGVSMHNPNFCYMTDQIRSMTSRFGVYTSYEASRRVNFTTVNPYISTSTPSRFWYFGRHGGAFPTAVQMQDMINFIDSNIQQDIVNNFNAGRTTLCREDLDAIRNCSMQANFTLENARLPSESSIIAMQNIAKRHQQNFPNILTESYSPDRFLFRHTAGDGQRTNQSARAFASGLFGDAEAQNVVYEDVPDNDLLLRAFGHCIEDRVSIPRNNFIRGPGIQEMQEQVNSKLGFTGSNRLTLEEILTMWEWCRFETTSTFEFSNSPTVEDSAWCAPFSVAHHTLLEYVDDLNYFHIIGYGVSNQRLIENLHCGLMQDLLTLLQSGNDTEQVTRVFIGYMEGVQSVLVTLGAFRDVWRLHEHNFAQQSARLWLSSILTPMATNLAVVRYDCDDGDQDILFYLNERPIQLPGCDQQTGVCKLRNIVRILQRFVGVNCETFFCSNN